MKPPDVAHPVRASRFVLPFVLCLAVICTSVSSFAAIPTKGTEILWDRYGIPHISAPDYPSLFYAYGYAQMEAHAELLLRLYTQARGRGAEFYGEAYLESDRWVRMNGIPARAKLWATQQRPEFAPLLRAFVDGLNEWATEHKTELSAPAKAMLPVTVEDVLAHGQRVIHFDWIINPAKLDGRLRNAMPDVHGSNEWAIAPAHSASGHAMLLSNSHLEWGDMHTYFEVQLTVAPNVNSYGAVWVGFPVLRQCFNDYLGWTQTTNNPDEADLYRLTLKDGGYVLDGKTHQFEVENEVIKIRKADGTVGEEPLTIRRTVQGPVVADRGGMTVAMRVVALDRPRLLEQFWRMGLAHNLAQWQDAVRMQQLPLFNTAYADRDGHILYLYNATVPVHPTGDYKYWAGVVPGDKSELIASTIHPYAEVPKVIDPPSGFLQNCNDVPWTSAYPRLLDPTEFALNFAPPIGLTPRSQRSIRILSQPGKMTFADVKAGKLSTHVETSDHFADDLIAAARKLGTERAKQAADVLAKWDRQADATSDGTLLFYRFLQQAGNNFQAIGGYAVPEDDGQPLTTPRGFADPAKAVAALDTVAGQVEKDYGSLHVQWGDVLRFRRGTLDLPGNGAPSMMGAIRTVNPGQFVNGKAPGVSGDTYFAVIEFSNPVHAEALLSYSNWSRAGSPHIQDQTPLMSKKEMRPVWRTRQEIEANLESRKVF
jgi:acyl-homoserine-lactone acylase